MALTAAGTAMDIEGLGWEHHPDAVRRQVEEAFPRGLNFKERLYLGVNAQTMLTLAAKWFGVLHFEKI